MSRHKRGVPPSGPVTYIAGGVDEGENELTIGRPIPPLVELTSAGPRFNVAASASATAPGEPPQTGTAGGVESVGTTQPRAVEAVQPVGVRAAARTAFLFPGQGAQTVGMAGVLCAGLPAAKELFDRAAAILGYNLLDICVNGPADRLNATDVSQPAIFVASLAALEQLKATEPDALSDVVATAGLSLGEYTALVYAGAMSFDDGLNVVQARGRAMQAAAEATPSGMVSILGLEIPDIESLVIEARGADTLEIANYLCPGNTVVSGAMPAIERIEQIGAQKGGLRTVRLPVAGAFHTNLMKPADQKLAEALAGATINAPAVPVWSNVDAKPHTNPADIRGLLVRQVLSPVKWEETLRGLLADGVERFYEIGPGRVLAGLLKRVNRKTDIRNFGA
jgi:[acyl-carrier-protein] S-malonyltransferase